MEVKEKNFIKISELFLLELIDSSLIKSSDALKKKIFDKNYSDAYTLELAILTIGSYRAGIRMVDSMKNSIIFGEKKAKNIF